MKELAELLASPGVVKIAKALLAYFAFSAIVDALPLPTAPAATAAGSIRFARGAYVFAFKTLHALAGNLTRAARSLKLPGAEQ